MIEVIPLFLSVLILGFLDPNSGAYLFITFAVGFIVGAHLYQYTKVYFGFHDGIEQEEKCIKEINDILGEARDAAFVIRVMKFFSFITHILYAATIGINYAITGSIIFTIVFLATFVFYSLVIERRIRRLEV